MQSRFGEDVFSIPSDFLKVRFWRLPSGAVLLPAEAESRFGEQLYRGGHVRPICKDDLLGRPLLVIDNGARP